MTFNPKNPPSDFADSDRFLLLSAYLDGEVTAAERQQVQHWLDTDAEFQQQYRKLLRLQTELQHRPETVLPPDISVQFFRTLDRRQQQRRLTVVGGMAIAALAVGLISQLFLRENSLIPQVAQHHLAPVTAEPDSLVLALNHPPIDIPADAKSTDNSD